MLRRVPGKDQFEIVPDVEPPTTAPAVASATTVVMPAREVTRKFEPPPAPVRAMVTRNVCVIDSTARVEFGVRARVAKESDTFRKEVAAKTEAEKAHDTVVRLAEDRAKSIVAAATRAVAMASPDCREVEVFRFPSNQVVLKIGRGEGAKIEADELTRLPRLVYHLCKEVIERLPGRNVQAIIEIMDMESAHILICW